MTAGELKAELADVDDNKDVVVSIPCKKVTLYKDITSVAAPPGVDMIVICTDKLSKVQEDDLNV